MKLSNLVNEAKKPKIKIIINESQFNRLIENLNIINEQKLGDLIQRKHHGKY